MKKNTTANTLNHLVASEFIYVDGHLKKVGERETTMIPKKSFLERLKGFSLKKNSPVEDTEWDLEPTQEEIEKTSQVIERLRNLKLDLNNNDFTVKKMNANSLGLLLDMVECPSLEEKIRKEKTLGGLKRKITEARFYLYMNKVGISSIYEMIFSLNDILTRISSDFDPDMEKSIIELREELKNLIQEATTILRDSLIQKMESLTEKIEQFIQIHFDEETRKVSVADLKNQYDEIKMITFSLFLEDEEMMKQFISFEGEVNGILQPNKEVEKVFL